MLEVAEARLVDVMVDGSLLIAADSVMGHTAKETGNKSNSRLVQHGVQQAQGSGGSHNGQGYALGEEDGSTEGSNTTSAGSVALPKLPSAATAAGAKADQRLVYSNHCGRVHMMNVTIQNIGVDWHHPANCYWKHQVQRHEACRIILHGRSEFEAYDVKITGNQVGVDARAVVLSLLAEWGGWGGWGGGYP